MNALLRELLPAVQQVLGGQFIGMYLDGSLTSGDFDDASDIDFVVVTAEDVNEELFAALQAMHDRIAALDSPLAIQLEGSYISRGAIRRYDPEHVLHPNLERGEGERLKMAVHDQAYAVHRWILRERGIRLAGPAPQTLIDPVSPAELAQAMQPLFSGWLASLLAHPEHIISRGYQSYVVLSICRIFYTLQTGRVASKPQAADWGKTAFGEGWAGLIARAWFSRSHSNLPMDPADLEQTFALIRWALEHQPQV